MQTAIHGVSLFIQTKDPGAKPRSSPFQRCHDWINILSIPGDHRLLELLVQTGAEKMLLAQKKAEIRKRLLAAAAEIVCCPIPAEQIPAWFRSGERSALLVSELIGDGSIGIWD